MFNTIRTCWAWISSFRSLYNQQHILLKSRLDDDLFTAGALEILSLDIVIEILSFLDRLEFIRISQVNRFFHSLIEDRRFWLLDDSVNLNETQVLRKSITNLEPLFCLERIQEHLQSSNKTSFKTIYYRLLLSPTPSELDQVFRNCSAVSINDFELTPETRKKIFLLGQPHSGKYSFGVCSTVGYSRPSDQKSVINMDFFFKRVVTKMENLSHQNLGNISGISHTKFNIESFGKHCFQFIRRSTEQNLSIMFTIDLSVKNNYFLNNLSEFLNPLFNIDISKDSPQEIRRKMGRSRLCIIGTKSDIKEISEYTLASQLMKLIDTSCNFWSQSIIYIETSSKDRKNMDHPYLFFSQSNIHLESILFI